MSNAVSLPNYTFIGQAKSSKRLTSMVHILSPENFENLSIPQTFGIKRNLLQHAKIVVAHTHTQTHARTCLYPE